MIQYNLRAMRFHWRQQLAVIVVVMAATGMLVLLLSALDSFKGLVGSGAEADNIVVMARGGLGEQWPDMSHVEPSIVPRLGSIAGVARTPRGELLVSPEFLYTAEIRGESRAARVTVRGVGPNAFAVHRMLEGDPLNGDEVLLGANVRNLLGDIKVGEELRIAGRRWRIGGFFRTRGRQSAFDSEIWAPLEPLMQARKAQTYGVIALKAISEAAVLDVVGRINANDDVLKSVRAVPEQRTEDSLQSTFRAFRAIQVTFSSLLIGVVGVTILSLYLNNVMRRRRDMALLRALGSSPLSVASGFVVENMLLAFSGALLGVLAVAPASALPLQTGSGNRLGLVVVQLHIGWSTAVSAILTMIATSVVCSLLPAFYASRFTITEGMRGN